MIALQTILPQHLLSRLVGKLAQLELPVWLKNFLIRTFMARYDIDLTEATCSSGDSSSTSASCAPCRSIHFRAAAHNGEMSQASLSPPPPGTGQTGREEEGT